MAIKRPVFACVLALILGELLAFLDTHIIIFVMCVPLFLVQKIITKKWNIFFMVIFLFSFMGFCVTKEQINISEKVYQMPENNVTVTGYYDKCDETTYGYRYELTDVKISGIDMNRIIVYADSEPDFQAGNKVCVTGKLKHFAEATNYGNFDARDYYRSLGIYVGITEKKVEIISNEISWFKYRMHRLRRVIKTKIEFLCNDKNSGIFSVCNSDKGGVFTAIVTGDKADMNEEIKNLYQVNGIAHVLAISGLHISAIGIVIYKLLRKKFKFILSGSMGMIVVVGFVFMTGEGISSIRAAGMFVFYLFSQMLGRKYDMLSAMSFVTVMVCLTNPFIILNSAFQMSFGAILGILYINPLLAVFLGVRNIKPIQKHTINAITTMKGKIKAHLKNVFLKVVQSLLISSSINLILTPILAWNYFQIPIYSIFLNLLVIPLMTVVIGSGILAIVIELVLASIGVTGVARIIILPGCIILEWYEFLCDLFERLPGNIWVTGKPAEMQICIYYVLLVMALIIVKVKERKRINNQINSDTNISKEGRIIEIRGRDEQFWESVNTIGKITLCALFSVCIISFISYKDNGNFNIYFNDVGQGDCIVLRKNDFVMMVDGGSTDVKELAKYRIDPLLKARGINSIDYVVVTHTDSDHISGILDMLKDNDSDKIIIKNLVLSSAIIRDESWESIVSAANASTTKITYIKKGDIMKVDDIIIKCLHPKADYITEERNGYSLVLNVSYKKFSMLLTGDISSEEEKMLVTQMDNEEENRSVLEPYTILKVPHHGSKYSSSEIFLERVRPKVSIISCGKGNSYGHPHRETLNRIKNIGGKIERVDMSGQIEVSTDGANVIIVQPCT